MKPPINLEEVPDMLEGFWGDVPEIIQHLFHTIPYGQQFQTSGGRKFHFKKFVEPRLNAETGKMEFGFDVRFEDGGSPDHLEFFLKHTGGGGCPQRTKGV